jgi:hypothetical protein
MSQEKKIDLASITSLAVQVAETSEDYDAAISEERDAEAEILSAAIEAARPALRALSNRLILSKYQSSGRNGCNWEEREEVSEYRGFQLAEDFSRQPNGTGNRGTYSGEALILTDSGKLLSCERSGTWSPCGEGDETRYEYSEVSAREAMNVWELEACLEKLQKKLKEQADSVKPERAKAARARAETLRALSQLVNRS